METFEWNHWPWSEKNDPPSYFKIKIDRIKPVRENNSDAITKITDDTSIAIEFNNYFANIGPDLSFKIQYSGKKTVEYFREHQLIKYLNSDLLQINMFGN